MFALSDLADCLILRADHVELTVPMLQRIWAIADEIEETS